jgi:hypothetical protein
MTLREADGYTVANNVLVKAGQSWFSPQIRMPKNQAGVSFEVWINGTATGSFIPRGGNRRRHARGGEVITTPTDYQGGERLPIISGIESTDLPDFADAPSEWLVNIGNLNANYAELQVQCDTGQFRITVIAASRIG